MLSYDEIRIANHERMTAKAIQILSRFAKILLGRRLPAIGAMFGNKGWPTKHTKKHESFTVSDSTSLVCFVCFGWQHFFVNHPCYQRNPWLNLLLKTREYSASRSLLFAPLPLRA